MNCRGSCLRGGSARIAAAAPLLHTPALTGPFRGPETAREAARSQAGAQLVGQRVAEAQRPCVGAPRAAEPGGT